MTVDVSVIITSYNVAAYIARAVESALEQQGVTLEVIIVDDCSTDETWQIILGLKDARIKAFQLPRNGGPSVARNKGFSEATGEWIAVLDGDDMFLPGRLQRMIERAHAAKAHVVVDNLLVHREADGAEFPMFPVARFSHVERLTLAQFIRERFTRFDRYTLGYLKPVFSANFLRRHALEYDPSLRIGEDYRLVAEALALGAVCVVEPTAGYRYTVRAGSISHRLSLGTVMQMQAADVAFVERHLLDNEALKAQKRRMFLQRETRAYILLVEAIKRGALGDVLHVLRICPTAALRLWEPLWVRLCGQR